VRGPHRAPCLDTVLGPLCCYCYYYYYYYLYYYAVLPSAALQLGLR
jgi:hypothetical protein